MKPRKTTPRAKKPKKQDDVFSASVHVLGRIFTATGPTALDALQSLKPEGAARGRSIVTVTHGDRRRERILAPRLTMRLFAGSPTMRAIALKRIAPSFEI